MPAILTPVTGATIVDSKLFGNFISMPLGKPTNINNSQYQAIFDPSLKTPLNTTGWAGAFYVAGHRL